MKRPTFFRGVAFAFVLALAGGALLAGMSFLMPPLSALKLVISLLMSVYVLYLLRASDERTGRAVVGLIWCIGTLLAWWMLPTLALFAGAHVAAAWLVRSLYFHQSVLVAIADLGLCILGASAALWAFGQTGSAALSIWCFFLVQALFVAIPTFENAPHDVDAFIQARRAAEDAVRRLSL